MFVTVIIGPKRKYIVIITAIDNEKALFTLRSVITGPREMKCYCER